jgi:hypothetical protein
VSFLLVTNWLRLSGHGETALLGSKLAHGHCLSHAICDRAT